VRSSDLYLQGEVELAPTWLTTLGLRSGRLRVQTQDQFLSNGDDSGTLSYGYNTPVLALQWLPSPGLNLYVSAGRGFESPTLNELAYRSDGGTGFNTSLQPQTSLQLELGAKWRDEALGLGLEVALFRADTDDEIGVLTNAGGRSTFQNVGSTRRSGAELGLRWQPQAQWRALLAMTYLDAVYRDSFETCSAVPCTRPEDRVTVPAGNRIAGTMEKSAFASLAWLALPSTELAFELRYQGEMPVNDRNSDFSPAATLAGLRLSHSMALGPGTLSVLARLDNLTDKAYAGAVIVNESNGRYSETAAKRNALLALRWQAPLCRTQRSFKAPFPIRATRWCASPQRRRMGSARSSHVINSAMASARASCAATPCESVFTAWRELCTREPRIVRRGLAVRRKGLNCFA